MSNLDSPRQTIGDNSFTENLPRVFVVQFVGDAFVGEADELGERRGSRRFIFATAPTPFRGQSLMLPVEQGNGEAEMILLRSTC